MDQIPEFYQPHHHRRTAIRIIKSKAGHYGLPIFHFDADFFLEAVNDPHFCYETDNEFVVYVEHTQLADACLATCSFDTENKYEVTAILCEKQTLYFENKNGIITFNFEISGLTGPTRTLYVHSILRDPGLTLRIEQNHIGRRAGKYREGDYPATEILAANHYMFAMREMLYALDLPQYLNRNRLGYLLILGFETNNEIHTDYPPHWHLIYRWPNHAGSPAPHIYLAPDGKMTENACYVDCAHGTHRDYSAGEYVANEPKVSFRNGQFIVTDGQHTIEGRILRNGGKDLPILCKVYTGMTVEQEALLFAEQNGFSAPLTAGIKLRAKVVGGDAISKAFLAATNRVGLSLNYDSQQLTDYRIGCVGTAFRLYKQMGEPLYCETMQLIVAAWEGKPDSFRASVLKGMMHFVELYHGEFSEERLLRALRSIHPVDIYRIGQDDPAKLRGWKKYVFPIYTAYNGKCRKDALPMKF